MKRGDYQSYAMAVFLLLPFVLNVGAQVRPPSSVNPVKRPATRPSLPKQTGVPGNRPVQKPTQRPVLGGNKLPNRPPGTTGNEVPNRNPGVNSKLPNRNPGPGSNSLIRNPGVKNKLPNRNPGGLGNNRLPKINANNRRELNLYNSQFTTIRPNPRRYDRPPYRFGGRSYYSYRPYGYHPYRPYYWGPRWRPWGYLAIALTAAAIRIVISNDSNSYYYDDNGCFYLRGNNGFTVVQAPYGARIRVLPAGYQTIYVNETPNYYYGGTYYEKSGNDYVVVAPMAGTIVENLPEGGEEVTVGEIRYVKIGDTYYLPFHDNGRNMYEIVDVRDGD